MKTITVKLYEFDELSDEAKEKAREWWRDCEREDPACNDENKNSMEEFATLFPIKITDWQYGGCNGGDGVSFKFTDDNNLEEMKGLRLLRWLENNIFPKLEKGKYYSTSGQYVDGQYHYKFRHSNAIKEICCPLTGYCTDETLIDTLRDFRKNPKRETTLRDLLEDCFGKWVSTCVADIEYQNEDEQVNDNIRANEYTFTIDGKRQD